MNLEEYFDHNECDPVYRFVIGISCIVTSLTDVAGYDHTIRFVTLLATFKPRTDCGAGSGKHSQASAHEPYNIPNRR